LKEVFIWAEAATLQQAGDTGELDWIYTALTQATKLFQPMIDANARKLDETAQNAIVLKEKIAELNALAVETDGARELAEALMQRDSDLAVQTRHNRELEAALAVRESVLAKEIRDLQELVEKHTDLIAVQKEQISERDKADVQYMQRAQELEVAIASRKLALIDQKRREEGLAAKLAAQTGRETALRAREQELLNSTSWRVTKPLRWSSALLLPLLRKLSRSTRIGP
jgi:hypothetical protein